MTTQAPPSAKDSTPPATGSPTGAHDLSTCQEQPAALKSHAGGQGLPAAAVGATPDRAVTVSQRLADFRLALAAQAVDDLESMRIAAANRLRVVRVDWLLTGTPEEADQAELVDALAALEKKAVRKLEKLMAVHPLAGWQRQQLGIGAKQLARLLAVIGDPYWHPGTVNEDGVVTHEPGPRKRYELRAYCGLHVVPVVPTRIADAHVEATAGAQLSPGFGSPEAQALSAGGDSPPGAGAAPRRRRGQRCNWSMQARKRVYLISVSTIKHNGPFRAVYLARRAHTAITHPEWTLGHSHNDGLRVVGQHILLSLWTEARRLHGAPSDLVTK